MTTEQEYRQDPRTNASLLKLFAGDTDLEIAKHKALHPFKPTDAMALGSLVHDLMENEGRMSDKFVVSTFDNYRTKAAQEWKKEMSQTGRTVVPNSVKEQAEEMAASICANAPLWMIRDECENEAPFYTDKLKCLCDRIYPKLEAIVDWKTTSATSASQFERECVKYGYFLQAYHYLKTSGYREFYFVAVSTVAPYPVWTFQVSEAALEYGEQQWQLGMDRMNATKSEDREVVSLGAPSWYEADEPTAQEVFEI